MLIVGLTGGIGSGKSAAAAVFAQLGAVVIDADQIAREVLAPGAPAVSRILELFGSDVVNDGVVDRQALAAKVFADPQALASLEAVTHPLIRQRFEEIVSQQSQDAVVVHDVPLLFERDLVDSYDVVITVEAPMSLRRERLLARGLSEEQIERRIAAQVSDEVRRAGSDIVIVNDSDLEALSHQVKALWQEELLPAAHGQ